MQTATTNYEFVGDSIHEVQYGIPQKPRKRKPPMNWESCKAFELAESNEHYYQRLMQVFENSQPHQSLAYVHQLASELKAVEQPEGCDMKLAVADIILIANTAYGIDLTPLRAAL